MKITVEADSIEQLVAIVGRISGDSFVGINHRVEYLPMSIRTRNCLLAAGIDTLDRLMEMSERELLNLPNFGGKSADEVRSVVGTVLLLRGQKK